MIRYFVAGILYLVTTTYVYGQDYYQFKAIIPEYLSSIIAFEFLRDRPVTYFELKQSHISLLVHYSETDVRNSCVKEALYYDLPTNYEYSEGQVESINVPIDPPEEHPLYERAIGLSGDVMNIVDDNGKVIASLPLKDGFYGAGTPTGSHTFINKDGIAVSHNMFILKGKLWVTVDGVIEKYVENSGNSCE